MRPRLRVAGLLQSAIARGAVGVAVAPAGVHARLNDERAFALLSMSV